MYGQSSDEVEQPSLAGSCSGSWSVVNSTYFAFDVGLESFHQVAKRKPTHGMTMDQASTQRRRVHPLLERSSLRMSSMSNVAA